MRQMPIVSVLIVLLVAGCGRVPGEERVLADVAASGILPAQAGFVAGAGALRERVTAFCERRDEPGMEAARAAWRQAMTAWQRVQVVRFGPVTTDNQAWKVQFWPDRNDLVRNKVDALLAEDLPLTAERVATASVVARGLSAAEYLLFDAEAAALERYQADRDKDAERRCRLLALIADSTEGVASFLAAGWSPDEGNYAAVFASPGPDNAEFASAKDALAALLDSILAAVEIARNDKLGVPLGMDNDLGIAKPYAVEAWRSRYSLPLLHATVDGARRLYYAGEPGDASFGVDDLLRARDAAALADAIDASFAEVAATAPRDLVLFDAVDDPQTAAALTRYHAALTGLAVRLKNDLPAALGVTLSFNDRDGD